MLLRSLTFFVVALTAGLANPLLSPRVFAQTQTQQRLVVMPFENLSQQTSDTWLQEAFADSLTLALAQVSGIQVMERSRLKQVLKDLSFTQSDWAEQNGAPQVGKLYGASEMVLGSFQHHGNQLQVSVRLVNVETGQIRAESIAQVQGQMDNLFGLQQDLARQLLTRLNVNSQSQAQAQSILGNQTTTAAQEWFIQAEEARHNIQMQEAIVAYRAALNLSPQYPRALAGMALAHATRFVRPDFYPGSLPEDGDLAMQAAQQALRLTPQLPEAYLAQAHVHAKRGQTETAIQDIQQILDFSPQNTDALLLLLGLEKRKGPDAMLTRLEQLKADFNDPWIAIRLATVMIEEYVQTNQGDLNAAKRLLLDAQSQLPQNFTVPFYLAQLAQIERDWKQAEVYSEQAYQLTENTSTILGLAQIKFLLNKYDQAKPLLQKYVKSNPKHAISYMYLGSIAKDQGDYPQARQHFQQAIRLKPDPHAYVELAFLEKQANRPAEMQSNLQQALKVSTPGSRDEARVFMLIGDYSDDPQVQQQYYDRAYTYAPIAHEIDLRRAQLAFKQGNDAEALQYLQRILEQAPAKAKEQRFQSFYRLVYLRNALNQEPTNAMFANDLGLWYQQDQSPELAQPYFEKAVQLGAQNAGILYNAGTFALEQQHLEQAVSFFQRATALDPGYIKAWYNLALTYQMQAKNDRALQALAQILQREPQHVAAQQLKASLSR